MNYEFLAIALFLAASVPALCVDTGVLSIAVRHSKTHAVIQAKLRIEGPKALETETDKDGKLTLSLPTGEYRVTAAAPGYSSMTWYGNLWARPNAVRSAEIFLFPAFAEAPVYGGTGVVSIHVRDWLTNYAVPAKIELEGPKSLSLETDGNGTITLPSGEYLEKVSAPGYKTMWWDSLMIRPGNANPTGLGAILVSLKPRPEEDSERSQLKAGYTLFVGYATDEQGHPVPGVRVRFKNTGAETTTSERGYYSFSIVTPPLKAEGDPATDTFTAEKPGYKTIVHYNVEVESEGPKGIRLDMERGTGLAPFNDLPMAARPTDEHQYAETEQPPKSSAILQLSLRDVITGYAVTGTVAFNGPQHLTLPTDGNGNLSVTLQTGEYIIQASAQGYEPLTTHYGITSGANLPGTIMLGSTSLPEDERPQQLSKQIRPGFTLLHGYFVDSKTGKPIAGVRVQLLAAAVETETNAKGHYNLPVVTPKEPRPGVMGTDTLVVEKTGYDKVIIQNFGIGGQDMRGAPLGLQRGNSVIRRDGAHKLSGQSSYEPESASEQTSTMVSVR